MVDGCAAVGHPVGDEFAHAGTVLNPDGDGIPQAAHLLAFAHGWTAIGRDLQEAVEGVAFIIAKFAQNGRQFDCTLQRFQNLVHFKVALRWRETRFMLFQKIARMAQARVLFFVIAPFDLSAFGGLWIARIAHIGRVALIAHERPADFLARSFELGIGTEKCQRMIDRHDRQVFANHFGNQAAPKSRTDDDIIGLDGAAMRDDALDATVFNDQRLCRRVGEALQLACGLSPIDQLAGNGL